MNNREQFESAWHKEYPLHSSTAFTRSGFDPERYANTRVQDGWLMWQAARATPADQVCATCNGHGMIGGPSFYAPDEGGEPCPDCATPADHSSIIRMLEGYAESYEMMARQGKDATVRCSSVAVDIRQNMAKWVRDRGTSADHIGDAAEKVDAGSVPVAEMPLTSGAGPQKLAWFKHPDSFAPGTKLYAQPPQPEAQSVRDAWISVDERLPEQHEWVLVSDGTWSAIGTHLDDEDLEPSKRWMDESAELIESNGIKITHWMPMPAPPQKPNEVKP